MTRTRTRTVAPALLQGETSYNVTVLQVHGRYLAAIYANAGAAPATKDVDTIVTLAAKLGRRLVAAQ